MISSEKDQHLVNVILQSVLIVLSIVGTLLNLRLLLKFSAYGFDFTDESFYLVSMANPFTYDFSVTQFGFFYHPLYLLLNGDIVALRQANFLITFSLAWGLSYQLLKSLASEAKEQRIALHAAAAGFATSALVFFDNWLPTPSYNSLALQALMVTGIGLLLANKVNTGISLAGWIIIGVGGWIAFMAKPTTALALGLGVFVYLLISREFSIRLLLLAAVSAIVPLLTSATLIDGSIPDFVERLKLGAEFAHYLDGGHSFNQILRMDDFQLGKNGKIAIILFLIASFLAVWGVWSKAKVGLILCIAISVAFLTITLLPFDVYRLANLGQFQGLLIFGVVFATVLIGLVFGRISSLKKITASQWGIAILFFVMPYIYAFGTNGNYWQAGGLAGIFWLLAGVTLIGPMVRERSTWLFALPLVLATQAVTATLLQSGLEQPYRQPQPLRMNTASLELGLQKSKLVLLASYAQYIGNAVTVAQNAGYKMTIPVIDLSGQSPGILYAFGAENIGQAWTIGGYAGSLKLAEAALNLTSCEKIAAAWVLFEPNGPRSIPVELLANLGADFPEGYERVGSWQTAEGAGGYAVSRTQEFYKPIATDKTLSACNALRKSGTMTKAPTP